MVACKTVGEYKRNQEKIKQFCLEEKKRAQQAAQPGPSTSTHQTPSGDTQLDEHEKLIALAKDKKKQQQRRRNEIQCETPTKTITTTPKENTIPESATTRQTTSKQRAAAKANESFITKSKAAALQQTRLHMERTKENGSFFKVNESLLQSSRTVTLMSDCTQNNPVHIYTSIPHDFMVTSPNSPEIPNTLTSTISTPRVDKAVKKIQQHKALKDTSPMKSENPVTKLVTSTIMSTA